MEENEREAERENRKGENEEGKGERKRGGGGGVKYLRRCLQTAGITQRKNSRREDHPQAT